MSYNGLTVPLDYGTWCCELVPASDYEGAGGGRLPFLSAGERRQLEEDCRTFDLYFRPNYDFRRTITTDIDAIRSFMRDFLNTVHWNLPTDNAGIERILKRAVADGRLMPTVNRERRMRARTERAPHAPQSWGATSRSGDGGAVAISNGQSFHQLAMDRMGLDSEGAWDYIEKYNAMIERIDAIQAATGAVLGGGDDSEDGDDAGEVDDDLLSDDAVGASTPLSDAQAFDYQPDMPNGDTMELAGSEGTPRNNQAQNKQTDDVVRILRLTPGQARQLHDEITGEGLGFHEIMERAKDMFNLW